MYLILRKLNIKVKKEKTIAKKTSTYFADVNELLQKKKKSLINCKRDKNW